MKCPYCNEENQSNAKFCMDCGKELLKKDSDENREEKNLLNPQFENIKGDKKKFPKKLIIIIVIAILILFCIIAGTSCEHVFSEATCIAAPICELCGKENGEALGHDWIEADCINAKICKRCEETEGEALGHDWSEATCEKAKNCGRCNETEGGALGHKSDSWKVIKKATCTEEGEETAECSRCKLKVTRETDKSKHKAGEWEIEVKATINDSGKRIKKCTICNEVIKEEEYEISESEYKEQCGTYYYSTIARNPEKYKGQHGKFYGKVIQVMEENVLSYTSYTLRVALNGDYNCVILVSYFAEPEEDHILEDDYITLYGEIQGTHTYETVMGNNVTIPYVDAEIIVIN